MIQRQYKNIVIICAALLVGQSTHAVWWDPSTWGLNHNVDVKHDTIIQFGKQLGQEFRESMPVIAKEAGPLVTALGQEAERLAPIFGDELRKASDNLIKQGPDLAMQVEKAAPKILEVCKEMSKTAQSITTSPIKNAAVAGVGLAACVAGIALCYKSINAYLQAGLETSDDRKKMRRSIALKKGVVGCALILLGCVPIFKSEVMVNTFA